MKILAIDTSNEICSVAITEDNKLIQEIHSDETRQHSINLMPMIKKALERADLTLNDIKLLGCGIGPGSFTGVRIGIATIKAFSDVRNTPTVGINSLEAQAYNVILKKGQANCKIISMIDAKNENAYIAVYRFNKGNLSIYKNPEATNITAIMDFFDFEEPVYIVGNVERKKIEPLIQAKRAEEQAQAKDVCEYEYIEGTMPLAEAIANVALNKYKRDVFGNSESLNPMYLQRPQAERQKEGTDESYIFELSITDVEEIKRNYDKFDNTWDYQTFEQDVKNSKYFVMKSNNAIIGFIGIKTIIDEIEIMNIVTRHDRRNRGIASSLLSYVIRNCPANRINLEVNEHNKVAKDLYSDFGFKQVGIRKGYYKGENAILMTL